MAIRLFLTPQAPDPMMRIRILVSYCILFFSLLASPAYSQSLPEFELSIVVSDTVSDVGITIGMLEEATNDKDLRIDSAVPPRPPGEYMYTYITGGGGWFLKDYRALSTDTTDYILYIDPTDVESRPITVSWDTTLDLSSLGSFRIMEYDAFADETSNPVDMTTTDRVETVPVPNAISGFQTMYYKIEVVRTVPPVPTIDLVASEDTYVRGSGAYDDINFDGKDSLVVKNGTTNAERYFSYLKFDLSSITDSIQSAVVTLQPYEVGGSPLHDVALTTEAWDAATLDWKDRPTVSDSIMTWTPEHGMPVTLDLTAEAQAAWAATGQTLEIRLGSNYGSSSDTDYAIYSAEESDTTSNRPIISITTLGGGGTTNQPPTVTITSPADSSSFTDDETIALEASASDSDGTVNQVEYFTGGASIGIGSGVNYSYSWSGMVAGSYYVTAVATDDDGATTTSDSILVTVTEGSSGSAIDLVASEDTYVRGSGAYDDINFNGLDSLVVKNGTVNAERYFSYLKFDLSSITDSIQSAVVTLYPYAVEGAPIHDVALTTEAWVDSTLDWKDRPNVSDSIMTWTPQRGMAVALDLTAEAQAAWLNTSQSLEIRLGSNYGSSSDTDWAIYGAEESDTTANRPYISVTTIGGGGGMNQPPTVSMTAPADSSTFTEGDTITLQASATDSDGTVNQVEYFTSSTSIGLGSGANYSYSWSGMAAGSYYVKAVATDDDGASTTSDSIYVTVNGSGGGADVVLSPIADAYVRGGAYKDDNYGTSDSLYAQHAGGNTQKFETYVKFDLTSVTDSIASATLKIHAFEINGTGTYSLSFVNNDTWTELGITFKTKANATPKIGSSWSPADTVSLDVTTEAIDEWDGDGVLSLHIASDTEDQNVSALFASKEHPTTALRPTLEIVTTSSGGSKRPVSTEEWDELPEQFSLSGNYPNPFNPTTTVLLNLPEDAEVSVEVFDLMGRRVMALPAQRMTAGANREVRIDASHLASGIYLYKATASLATKDAFAVGRMILMK